MGILFKTILRSPLMSGVNKNVHERSPFMSERAHDVSSRHEDNLTGSAVDASGFLGFLNI